MANSASQEVRLLNHYVCLLFSCTVKQLRNEQMFGVLSFFLGHPPTHNQFLQHTRQQHSFNGLFSTATCVSCHQKGKPFWLLNKQKMRGYHQLAKIQSIYHSLQRDKHAGTLSLIFTGQLLFVMPNQSTEDNSCYRRTTDSELKTLYF